MTMRRKSSVDQEVFIFFAPEKKNKKQTHLWCILWAYDKSSLQNRSILNFRSLCHFHGSFGGWECLLIRQRDREGNKNCGKSKWTGFATNSYHTPKEFIRGRPAFCFDIREEDEDILVHRRFPSHRHIRASCHGIIGQSNWLILHV